MLYQANKIYVDSGLHFPVSPLVQTGEFMPQKDTFKQ